MENDRGGVKNRAAFRGALTHILIDSSFAAFDGGEAEYCFHSR